MVAASKPQSVEAPVTLTGLAPDDMAAVAPKSTDEASAKKAIDELTQTFSGNVFEFAHFAMMLWGIHDRDGGQEPIGFYSHGSGRLWQGRALASIQPGPYSFPLKLLFCPT